DVEAAAQRRATPAPAVPRERGGEMERQPVARPSGEVEVVELSKLQTTVAMRLAQSAFSAPHFYVTSEIAMDDAVRLRQMFNEAVDKSEAISLNDLVVKAVARALTKFPEVNASWADGRIERKRNVNIGIAVGLPDRLIVPVLRNADQKPLKDIARESKQLIDRARTNKAAAQDYVGNTFSISNLGMYDVDQFSHHQSTGLGHPGGWINRREAGRQGRPGGAWEADAGHAIRRSPGLLWRDRCAVPAGGQAPAAEPDGPGSLDRGRGRPTCDPPGKQAAAQERTLQRSVAVHARAPAAGNHA